MSLATERRIKHIKWKWPNPMAALKNMLLQFACGYQSCSPRHCLRHQCCLSVCVPGAGRGPAGRRDPATHSGRLHGPGRLAAGSAVAVSPGSQSLPLRAAAQCWCDCPLIYHHVVCLIPELFAANRQGLRISLCHEVHSAMFCSSPEHLKT